MKLKANLSFPFFPFHFKLSTSASSTLCAAGRGASLLAYTVQPKPGKNSVFLEIGEAGVDVYRVLEDGAEVDPFDD